MVLVMSVHPGYGGQEFLPESLERIRTLRERARALGTPLDIEVDGGIDHETAPLVVEAGANVLVAGTAVFGAAGCAKAIKKGLKQIRAMGAARGYTQGRYVRCVRYCNWHRS